jgi:hypothetical protein
MGHELAQSPLRGGRTGRPRRPGHENTQGGVPGSDQLAGHVDDPLQHPVQRQVGSDTDDGVEQTAEPVLRDEDLLDALQELLEQVVEPGPGQGGQSASGPAASMTKVPPARDLLPCPPLAAQALLER